MQLSTGDKIGRFEIVGLLGKGGMGEVYRGRDTQLKREVALKVLPGVLARDPERMARFQREAEVLASLNHPNIAAIYGVESSGEYKALVMELVEGEAPKGPLPFDEAWAIASQITAALEYAHEKNVIHRDLKPANVKVTPEGIVKLLDFGLAKALSNRREASVTIGEDSPTLTMGATEAGVILGTAAYMAPEQAKGKPVDKRADIWSFGVVLHELLTGQRLFKGEDIADTLAQVLTKEIDLNGVAPRARKLLRRCLEKDPKNRLRDIGEARYLVEEAAAVPEAVIAPAAPASKLPWIAAGAFALIAVGVGGWAFRPQPKPLLPLTRLEVDLGADVSLGTNFGADVAISPDASKLAYISGGKLFTLRLDRPDAKPVDMGAPGSSQPAFSTDGEWIVFRQSGVKKIAASGGTPLPVAMASALRGLAWAADGSIVGALGSSTPLSRMEASGGEPKQLTTLTGAEANHHWPQVLPGQDAVVFTAGVSNYDAATIEIQSLKDGRRKTLIRGGSFGRVVFASDGQAFLTYINRGTMFAVPFDAGTLDVRGTPTPVLDGVGYISANGGALLDFSRTGTLVYRSGTGGALRKVQFMDASSKTETILERPDSYTYPRLSPDGQRLLIVGTEGSANDVWVYDVKGGRSSRLTIGLGATFTPIWTPDGRHVVFQAPGGASWTRSDGANQPQPLVQSKDILYPWSFTPKGDRLAYIHVSPQTGYDLWTVPIENTASGLKAGTPEKFLVTAKDERHASFSPDGRWIAYASDVTGKFEVYVRAFPDKGGQWTVSVGGGHYPTWSANGRELFYRTEDGQVMVAKYSATGDTFVSDPPRKFADRKLAPLQQNGTYDVAPDGRIVGLFPVEEEGAARPQSHVTFLINFADDIARKVGTGK